MALKVSSKLGRRARRYMFWNRVNKMISNELAKQIQIEIDNQIIKILQSIAANEQVDGTEVESDSTPFMVRKTPSSPNFN